MRKLSLLLLMLMSIAITALAQSNDTLPSPDVFGDSYYIYQRSNRGSAVDPVTHKRYTPQDGTFEVSIYDGGFNVYIKNIVYGSEQEFGDYWVQGYNYGDGKITVPLGQVIRTNTGNGFYVKNNRRAVLAWGTVSYNALTNEVTFVRDGTVSEVTYSLDGKTILIEETGGPVAIDALEDVTYEATGLGIVWEEVDGEDTSEDNYEWAGYCEWGTEIDTSPYVINWQPEGELKTYNRTTDCIHFSSSRSAYSTFSSESLTGKCDIVFGKDGRTVYLKDPLQSMSYGTWVKGTLNQNGIITIDLPQYLFCDESNNLVSLVSGSCYVTQTTLDDGSTIDKLNTYTNWGYHFAYFKLIDNTVIQLETAANPDAPYPDNLYGRGLIAFDSQANQGAVEANIVYTLDGSNPDEPTQVTASPSFNGYTTLGIHAFFVEILEAEPSTIYYRYQFDGGEFTQWATYELPLSFTIDGRYSVEAYAQAPDKLPSSHVTYDFEVSKSTGISEVVAGKQAVDVRYYNMMGQEMPTANGMTIIVTTYSDGTTSTAKVIK